MGHRDFINQIWGAVEDGIKECFIEITEDIGEEIKIPQLTKERVKYMAKKNIVKGCYKEGASKEFLKDAFDLNDSELEDILGK